jgi:hypothetical protein
VSIPPKVVQTWPLDWKSIDDQLWVARMADGNFIGAHNASDGHQCSSPRTIDVTSGSHHHVVQEEPLTLAPSLLCEQCGWHGFVRDGKWVPA